MDKNEFKRKTKIFAINSAILCKRLRYDVVTSVYVKQLVRCSSSVAANYRAACRAKSKADFINKMRIVEEEADESIFFLEMIETFHPDEKENIEPLLKEADHILAITVKSINTALFRSSTKSAN